MLKRIKIVTSLLLVLAVFGLLQLTSGGLFFNALKNDKENFTVLQTIRQQQSTLNGSWVALLQTRNTPQPRGYPLHDGSEQYWQWFNRRRADAECQYFA